MTLPPQVFEFCYLFEKIAIYRYVRTQRQIEIKEQNGATSFVYRAYVGQFRIACKRFKRAFRLDWNIQQIKRLELI